MTSAEPEVVGRVEEIRVYPVRSLAGTAVSSVEVGRAGLRGDRAFSVVGADGAVVRGKDVPGMRDLASSGDAATDAARLTALIGRPVRLEAVRGEDGAVAPVHLVSRQALVRAEEGVVPEGCSAEDPRANLLVSLSAGEDERSWTGRAVRVGEALLAVTRTPKHCLGVYADVRQPGLVRVGDPLVLEDSATAPRGDAG